VGLGLFASTVSLGLAGRQPLAAAAAVQRPPDRWGERGTAATAGAVLAGHSARPSAGRAFGLIGVAFRLRLHPRPALGGVLAEITSACRCSSP